MAIEDRVGFGPRFLALLIDVLVLFSIYYLMHLSVEHLYYTRRLLRDPETEYTIVAIQGLIYMFYCLTDYICYGTPGLLILGLRIRDENGGMPGLSQLFKRLCFKNPVFAVTLFLMVALPLLFAILMVFQLFIAIPIPLPRSNPVALLVVQIITAVALIAQFLILCGAFLSFSENRQTLHDSLSDTAVYRVFRKAQPVAVPMPQPVEEPNRQQQPKAPREPDELIFE